MEHDSLSAGFLKERLVLFVFRHIEGYVWKVLECLMGDFVGMFGLDGEFVLEQSLKGDGELGKDGLEFRDSKLNVIRVDGHDGEDAFHFVFKGLVESVYKEM